MNLIGVTGGVGSGKSEILRYLQTTYNCRILMADDAARALEAPGGGIYEDLIALLEEYPGTEPITHPDGQINNPEMARRIFSNPALRERVNQMVHPAVKIYALDEYKKEREAGRIDFFVLEAALLIEAGYTADMDSLWYIYCNADERRRRLRASRGYSDEKIDNIMKSQLSEEIYRKNADVVIDNSGDLAVSCRQVDEALQKMGYMPKKQ